MKKIFAVLLCVLMCAPFAPTALAANAEDLSFEAALASQLKALGLFLGVEEAQDGTANFDLERSPSRTEALIMLLRALGKGTEAKRYSKTHPFSDVPAWADGYVSYAYGHGLTNGVSGTLFGAESAASAEMYLTFMLRALGYLDGEDRGFTWDAPWALAAWCGILPTQLHKGAFLRADVVTVTCAALYANMNGTQTPLYQRLMSEGAFTEEQFNAVFPDDPLSRYRLMDSRISEAIAAREPLGALGDNTYAIECHIIADIVEADGVLTVSALVCIGKVELQKDNTRGSYGTVMGPWTFALDAKTLELRSCHTVDALAAEGLSFDDYFSEETLAFMDQVGNGMGRLSYMVGQMQIDSGLFTYRQPTYTYEESLAKATSYLYEVIQTIETEPCTILLGWSYGVAHGPYAHLYAIYKPGSAVGEGEWLDLPMPGESYWGNTSPPEDLRLSEDGLTLYYSYHYDERLTFSMGEEYPEIVRHEAGTYSYTVDLNTGEVTWEILED